MSILWSNSLDSTNKEAVRLLQAGSLTDKLSFIAALEQTSGRGQGDHIWTSAPGENLTFSVVLQDPNPVSLFQLNGKKYKPEDVLLRLVPMFESFPAGRQL